MLSLETENRLAALIGTIADNERKVELKKQMLANLPLFTPYNAFSRLDTLGKGYISGRDLQVFLRENGVYVTEEEAEEVISFFSLSSSVRLRYEDFKALVLPSDALLKSTVMSRDPYPYSMPSSVEYALSQVLQCEIDGNNRMRVYSSALRTRYDYNVFDSFRAIDRLRSGYITEVNLGIFLRNAGHYEDPGLFIRRLDTLGLGRLSYNDFVDGLMPQKIVPEIYSHSPKYYDRSFYSEQKPSRMRPMSPEPRGIRSAYKPSYRSRDLSEERDYSSPFKTPTRESTKSPYVSPYKTFLEPVFVAPLPAPITKKLDYPSYLSPTKRSEILSNLIEALREQLYYQRKLEQTKEELSLQSDFNFMEGFKHFDTLGRESISLSDFAYGLKELGIYSPLSEISLVFNRLDRDMDGRIRYSDMREFLTPKSLEHERLLTLRPPYGSTVYGGLTSVTKLFYKRMFEAALDLETSNEQVRAKLRRNPLFDCYDAFALFDLQGKGFVSRIGLREFLEDQGMHVSDSEVQGLLEQYDHDKDGRISYSEFVREISPQKIF